MNLTQLRNIDECDPPVRVLHRAIAPDGGCGAGPLWTFETGDHYPDGLVIRDVTEPAENVPRFPAALNEPVGLSARRFEWDPKAKRWTAWV